ncbi:MAG: pyridoxamine 5'-phosphate oxidase family protein, partial [Polyangiales bacterium]
MTKRPVTMLSDELVDFIAQGVSLLVGTCDADRIPHAMRAVGLQVHDDRRHATVYLPEVTAQHTVTNVAVNPRVALFVSQPIDHRSLQLKGSVIKVSPASDGERPRIEAYVAQFGRGLNSVGMPFELSNML